MVYYAVSSDTSWSMIDKKFKTFEDAWKHVRKNAIVRGGFMHHDDWLESLADRHHGSADLSDTTWNVGVYNVKNVWHNTALIIEFEGDYDEKPFYS